MRYSLRYVEAGERLRLVTRKGKELLVPTTSTKKKNSTSTSTTSVACAGQKQTWANRSSMTTRTSASGAREGGGDGEKEVLYHVEKRVGVLTLNAPARLNAFTMPMSLRWKKVVDQIEADLKANRANAPRALVIRGMGKAFCAGGDLKLLASIARSDDVDSNARTLTTLYSNFLSIRKLDVPIVAALHGHCVGGGAGIAIGAADLRVAAPNTTMRFNFLRELGITPGMGTTQTLRDVLGSLAGSTQCLLQIPKRDLDAQELLRKGMVTLVVDEKEKEKEMEMKTKSADGERKGKRGSESWGEKAFVEAFELAQKLADTNPVAISCITNRRRDLKDVLEREGRDQALSFASPIARKIFSKL